MTILPPSAAGALVHYHPILVEQFTVGHPQFYHSLVRVGGEVHVSGRTTRSTR
jgi:hypothetical protein